MTEGEFDLIRRLFAPLAEKEPGAFGLEDDVAALLDTDFVATKDALVAGVHFPEDERFDLIARKALRVNLSDLAAKGAKPFGYLLGCVWPTDATSAEMEEFAAGLKQDQETYKITLLGGDTTRHRRAGAPLTLSVTMFGLGPRDGVVRRNGARVGDDVYVTGTIGDAGLGLMAAQGEETFPSSDEAELHERLRLPSPRLRFGGALPGVASAAIDVSDGLVADAGHLAAASGVAIEIDAARLPMSDAAIAWRARQSDPDASITALAGAGDDYEILFTAPPERRRAIDIASQVTKTSATKIGVARSGHGVRLLNESGAQISLLRPGYDHFR
ncbi:MAG: thiamine-phosphate kinase [Pseudomonadota bacterium]